MIKSKEKHINYIFHVFGGHFVWNNFFTLSGEPILANVRYVILYTKMSDNQQENVFLQFVWDSTSLT